MDIPDEVLRDAAMAAWDTFHELGKVSDERTATPRKFWESVVEAVAPHIARAAQVAILREVVAELRRASWTSADPVEAEVAKGVALAIGRTIERKAEALEVRDVGGARC